MKKLLILLAAAFFCLEMGAVPAMPGSFLYKQPDGSVIRLERHGDEFFSWTTLAGTSQVVILGADGFWKKSSLSESAMAAGARERARANEIRRLNAPRTHSDNVMTHGERHIPVLLVAFQDVPFTLEDPLSHFANLLNQQGYSENGATGSVQDYYFENSDGQFKPIFDVYGPVTLPHDMIYYGEAVRDDEGTIIQNDIRPSEALRDGCNLLDDVIDFSKYDYDGDGKVDMTLFYYAGHNQAEGGSENAIWPHQHYLSGNNRYDGKTVSRYFCTSELRGSNGDTPCPIGTTCHEFAHSLGVPDFYDTDYEKHGECMGLGIFSLMSNGSYNNNGNTPPYFNTEERITLHWMTREDVLPLLAGPESLVSVKNSVAYYSETSTEGEYFLYECRDGSGWDASLPRGLVVYHVDKSKEHIVGGISAYTQWDQWGWYNTINAYGDHPCFYVVPSANQENLNYKGEPESMVFPGSGNIHSFIPYDWSGDNVTGLRISDILFADGVVSFNTVFTQSRMIEGRVEDLSGNGIPGVFIQLSEAAPALKSLRKASPRRIDYEAVTDANGDFFLSLEGFEGSRGHLTLSKAGFRTTGCDINLGNRITHTEIALHRKDQGELRNYAYYDKEDTNFRIWSYITGANSQMAAIRIPAEEIPSAGILRSISFRALWDADHIYLVVDRNGERLLTTEVFPSQIQIPITYDLSEHNLLIEPGSDVYVGIAVDNAHPRAEDYNGFLFYITPGGNNCYGSEFNLTSSSWISSSSAAGLMLDVEIVEKLEGGEDPAEPGELAQMGIPSIADPSCGHYAAGSNFQLQLSLPEGLTPESVLWAFDGQSTGAKSVSLTAGKHLVTARVKWPDGSQETMSLQIDVK